MKVVYLDQNAWSDLYKEDEGRTNDPQE